MWKASTPGQITTGIKSSLDIFKDDSLTWKEKGNKLKLVPLKTAILLGILPTILEAAYSAQEIITLSVTVLSAATQQDITVVVYTAGT